jgi:uncharacterized membrane protein YoaK (UPF0700 family)
MEFLARGGKQMERDSDLKSSKLSIGVAIGFVIGALFGGFIGITTHDLAVWLSIGIGCGIALGAVFGFIMDHQKN